ncbi:MAG: hypothetical protein HYT16_00980 [DPANN group archaeon]|nr:hypothetical protein [DPANN group archaeon]
MKFGLAKKNAEAFFSGFKRKRVLLNCGHTHSGKDIFCAIENRTFLSLDAQERFFLFKRKKSCCPMGVAYQASRQPR